MPNTAKRRADTRRTEDGLRRLVAFSDAVVAFAMTLLVLPLSDAASTLKADKTFLQTMDDHSAELLGFIISFAVIWLLWRNHHSIMENFRSYNPLMFNLHFVWLLSIVLVPLATALISNERLQWADTAYILVLALAIGSLVAIARAGLRHPELVVDDDVVRHNLAGWAGFGTLIALGVALVLTLLWPSLGSLPLLVLLIPGPIAGLVSRVRARSAVGE
ncbi:TMEM175 family protein [Gordonia sp. (in: high G+C Gram-positive bacteria)]|uniref:TMEM175 family protein n=1 Tax=Gordonia sp. (in: high G+C Gram-positive bacteria) TaxID=84139 RepID=UPI0039E220A5